MCSSDLHPAREEDDGHARRNSRSLFFHPDLRGTPLDGESAKLMEIVVHEILHAYNWAMDEEVVTQYARDCVRIYNRLTKERP